MGRRGTKSRPSGDSLRHRSGTCTVVRQARNRARPSARRSSGREPSCRRPQAGRSAAPERRGRPSAEAAGTITTRSSVRPRPRLLRKARLRRRGDLSLALLHRLDQRFGQPRGAQLLDQLVAEREGDGSRPDRGQDLVLAATGGEHPDDVGFGQNIRRPRLFAPGLLRQRRCRRCYEAAAPRRARPRGSRAHSARSLESTVRPVRPIPARSPRVVWPKPSGAASRGRGG